MRKQTKFIISCALMTLGSATGAYADDCCPPKPCCPPPKPACQPVCKPVCPPKPCCTPVECPCLPDDCCKRNVCPPVCVITPKVDFIKCPEMDWFITGDYIYWTAREENLEFADLQLSQTSNATSSGGGNKTFHVGNKYESGFKAGLGTDFCHDGWDLYAEYTWFETNNKKHTGTGFFSSTTGVTTPFLNDDYWFVEDGAINSNNPPLVGSADSASAKWRLNFNVVDLELGRNFYVSPRLILRPFYGLKGAWNKQHMNLVFAGVANVPVLTMHNRLKNWGIGIRGGMDTSWHFTRDFSIVGNMAFTGLWQEIKAKRFDTTLTGTVLSSTVDMKETQYNVKPVIEWMLGLKWETGLSCDEYHLAITAAWEEQVWFGQNKFLRLPGTSSGSGGDLSLQGLTVDVRFDF